MEVSEEKANQRVEEFKRQLKSLTVKLKEAENRAELAEKTVKKLQKEVDRLEGRFFGFHLKPTFFCLSSDFLLFEHKFKKFFNQILRNFLGLDKYFKSRLREVWSVCEIFSYAWLFNPKKQKKV